MKKEGALLILEPMKKMEKEEEHKEDHMLSLTKDFLKAVKAGEPEDVAMLLTEMVDCCLGHQEMDSEEEY